jgi:hypothetical protein
MVVVNLRLRSAAARLAGVEEHVCELQLGLVCLAALKVLSPGRPMSESIGSE